MILPSGIATLLWLILGVHPAFAVISVHNAPSFVDRHTSFTRVMPLLLMAIPPINTMLPSGIATLLWLILGVQIVGAFADTGLAVKFPTGAANPAGISNSTEINNAAQIKPDIIRLDPRISVNITKSHPHFFPAEKYSMNYIFLFHFFGIEGMDCEICLRGLLLCHFSIPHTPTDAIEIARLSGGSIV